MPKVWILLKTRLLPEPHTVVHCAYSTREGLEARLERIEAANPYPLEQLSANVWRMGPTEDEGFFGNKPIEFLAQEIEVQNV